MAFNCASDASLISRKFSGCTHEHQVSNTLFQCKSSLIHTLVYEYCSGWILHNTLNLPRQAALPVLSAAFRKADYRRSSCTLLTSLEPPLIPSWTNSEVAAQLVSAVQVYHT